MGRVAALSLALAVASALALPIGSPAHAETPVTVNAEGLQRLADAALRAGYARQALDYAEVLLARDPTDTTALIIKARALRALGRYAEAEAAARAAWAQAETDPARFGAAMTLAQALSLQNQRTAAQLWLRTAAEYAPNARARAIAERDFAYVRSQNPLRLRFDGTMQPSSNLNNGAKSPLFEFMGIPFILSGDAMALSGVDWGMGVSGSYRLAQSQTSLTDLRFSASQQGVWLSPEARAQAPSARNGDYAYGVVELGLSRRIFLPQNGVTLTGTATAGHNWYGGAGLTDYLRLDLGSEQPVGPGRIGFLAGSAEWQFPLDDAADPALVLDLVAGLVAAQRNGDSLRLSFGLGETVSDSIEAAHTRLRGALDWQHAKPVLGMGLGVAVAVEARDYPLSVYSFFGAPGRKAVGHGFGGPD